MPPDQIPIERLEQAPWCVEYRVSEQQMRDRIYDVRIPPGMQRIACVGDSFVFGEGVSLADCLPRRIEKELGHGFQVMNLGRPGHHSRQNVVRLVWALGRFECRRALVVFVPNDIEQTSRMAKRQAYINDLVLIREQNWQRHQARAWYAGGPRLLDVVGSRLAMRSIRNETIQWYRDLYSTQHNAGGLEMLAQQLSRLATMSSCRVALVLYPLMDGFERGYPLAEVHARVAGMARQAGIPVLDLAVVFAGSDTESQQVHPADHHPNSRAHGIAAGAMVAWLRAELPDFLEIDATE